MDPITYYVIVYMFYGWMPQYNLKFPSLNEAYHCKMDEDNYYNGRYIFRVVETTTKLTELTPPTIDDR